MLLLNERNSILKLLVVSTPRSGNTWLRYMLSTVYQLHQHAVHTPQALDWAALPDKSIVQLHWHRTPEFQALLAQHQVKPVTIARHPLAVLLSIWQFAVHEPATAQWLGGEGGDESAMLNQPVDSAAFLNYACGPRAKALLSVSAEWWDTPGTAQVRYEDLVKQPLETLTALCHGLGPAQASLAQTLQDNAIDKLRLTSSNNHFWQGQPDAWQQMVPPEFALQVQHAHSAVFQRLGYVV